MLRHPSRRLLPLRRGVTIVEFAVVAPVVFAFIFALFEFGRMVMVQHSIANAAREGCRTLSLSTTLDDDDVDAVVRDSLSASIHNAADKDVVRVSINPSNPKDATSGSVVEVTVEVRYSEITWLPGNFFGLGDPNIFAESRMERE